MLQYTLLLQVLFVVELCGWEMPPEVGWLGRGEYSEISEDQIETITNAKEMYLLQTLNHFNGETPTYFSQRVFIMDEYYQSGGPAFLMIDSWRSPPGGNWIEYAKRFGAICFYLPRRYYGNTKPTGDITLENLQYLTSEQTLEDAANFIDAIELPKDTKWIVFGGGYEGSLAAWMRLKYPHLVHGAVASSAPFNFQIEYPDFYRIMWKNFANRSSKCRDSMDGLFSELHTLLQNQTEQQHIASVFRLCNSTQPFTRNDMSHLMLILLDWLALTDQVSRSAIDEMCNVMTDKGNRTFFERFEYFLHNSKKPIPMPIKCVSYKYSEKTKSLGKIHWNTHSDQRVRLYESCTNLGLFSTQPFVDLSFYNQLCVDVFGPKYYDFSLLNSNIGNTYTTYGGTDLVVTNVVFVQGTADPWFAAGVQRNISSEASAVIIEGGSYCADMNREMSNDSPQLKAARVKIASYIETWLKN